MKIAIHTLTRGGRRIAVAGTNPVGPRGGTSGKWLDGIVVAEGRAVSEIEASNIDPSDAYAIAKALGRPVGTADKYARELIRNGDALSIAVAIHGGKLAQRCAQPSEAELRAAELKAWTDRIAAERDAVLFDGVRYGAERNAAGTVKIDPAFNAALRAAGCRGLLLGHVYSQAQQRAGAVDG